MFILCLTVSRIHSKHKVIEHRHPDPIPDPIIPPPCSDRECGPKPDPPAPEPIPFHPTISIED